MASISGTLVPESGTWRRDITPGTNFGVEVTPLVNLVVTDNTVTLLVMKIRTVVVMGKSATKVKT